MKQHTNISFYISVMIPFTLAIFLTILSTQSLWTKRNYLKWLVGLFPSLTIFYFLTPLHTNLDTILILCMPLYWLLLSFICDFIFKKVFLLDNEQNLTEPNIDRQCLVFVVFNNLNIVYDKKLRRPKTIDYIFSTIVLLGPFWFTYLVSIIWDKVIT